jgi:hypothetical protein
VKVSQQPADVIFNVAGVVPAVVASGWTYMLMRKPLALLHDRVSVDQFFYVTS